jgi:hypothetical protein
MTFFNKLLEGMDGIAQDAIAEQRLGSLAVHHVGGAVEDLVDLQLQFGVFEDADGAALIEFHQHVDIAVRCSVSSRHRAEDGGMGHA